MALIDERYSTMAAGLHLPPDAARQLLDAGFVVVAGRMITHFAAFYLLVRPPGRQAQPG